jgi:hypothetical protein
MPRSKYIVRQTPDQELQEIAFEFHKRAFGEEMARVNFLPVVERKDYLARVRLRIRRHRQQARTRI